MRDAIERLPRGYEIGSYQIEDSGRSETRWRWRKTDTTCALWVAEVDGWTIGDAETALFLAWDNALATWVCRAVGLGLHAWPTHADQSDARIGTAKPGRNCALIDLWTTGRFALGGPHGERAAFVVRLQQAGLIRGVKLSAGEWDLPPTGAK